MRKKSEPMDEEANLRQFFLEAALEKHEFMRAEALLAEGADLNVRYRFSKKQSAMPIVCSLAQNGNLEGLRFAISHGAKLETPSELLESPLRCAAKHGFPEIIRFLLENGAAIDAANNEWGSALHSACYANQLDCAMLLADHGADINMKTGLGSWPLHICCNRTTADGVEILAYVLSLQPDLYQLTDNSLTCAEHIVRYDRPLAYLQQLLDGGYDPHLRQSNGYTLREFAAKHGKSEAASFLDATNARSAFTSVLTSSVSRPKSSLLQS